MKPPSASPANNAPSTALTLALVQMPVITAQPGANLSRASTALAQAREAGAELAILPELWTTGFNWPWNARHAAEHAPIHRQVSQLAREHHLWLAGSLLTHSPHGPPTNTLYLHSPDGEIVASYSKIHLFTLTGEDRYLAAGQSTTLASTPWGKLGLTICYDLRFPELWRKLALQGATIMLCPAGFPKPRRDHWRTLLRARAIENQCFVVAVNRIGTESIKGTKPLDYFGNSCVIDPWGETLKECGDSSEVAIVTLDPGKPARIREQMTVLQDRRPELY